MAWRVALLIATAYVLEQKAATKHLQIERKADRLLDLI